jgi:hypothetical protein
MRRLQTDLSGTVYGNFDWRIHVDLGGAGPLDVTLDWNIVPEFGVRAGKFKPPTGLERLIATPRAPFIEGSFVTLLQPNRDLGVAAYAVAAGFLFGYLLVLTGNVFFCGLVHATNNLVTAGVMPRLGTPDGTVVVPSEPVLYLYLIAVFLLVFLVSGIRRNELRRVFLPDSDPSLHA